MIVAIIPARGGSKRVPHKNVRDFAGKPMIAWSIEAALASRLFDRILVSTDDDAVARVAHSAGAEAPFVRPAELADDHTPTLPVIRHAIQWLEQHTHPVAAACCIYATAPFLRADALRRGLELLQANRETEFVLPVTDFEFPIQRALQLAEDGGVSMFWPEYEQARSQDLPRAFHDAGQWYWGTRDAWLNRPRVYSSRCRALILPRDEVQDIDTEADWRRAELMFRGWHHD